MKPEFNTEYLRPRWERLTTPELEAELASELEKAVPDDEAVLLILHILEAREPDELPELTERERKAFDQYQQKVRMRRKKTGRFTRWVSVAACAVLIMGLLFAVVPQQAEAETFWEMLQRLTGTVLEIFDRDDRFSSEAIVFKTDNSGLQQVHDAVVELGVTEPVVPMWLPDGCEILELDMQITPMLKGIFASFSHGDDEIVYKLSIYEGEPAHQYYRDDIFYDSYERNGATYTITRNNGRWSVIWTKDNIECHITLDCQGETLRRILKSIYVMEE